MLGPLLGILLGGTPRGDSGTVRVTWSGGFLCIPVSHNGEKPHNFTLDTGTWRSYLTRRAFARMQAAGGKLEKDGTLTVAGLSINGLSLPPVNFDHEEKGYEKLTVEGKADGFIGTDVLENYRLGLNLAKNEVRIWSGTSPLGPINQDWFGPTLDKSDGAKTYEVTDLGTKAERYAMWLNLNNISVPAMIDTGSPVTLIRSDFLPYLEGGRKAHGSQLRYYGGTLDFDRYRVDWVAPWNTTLGGERRIAALDPKLNYKGIAGRDLLTPFSVLLDYPGRKAYFCGTKGKPQPPFDGIEAFLAIGIVVRYPKGPLHLPPKSSCRLPSGFMMVRNADTSLDILPPETVWPQSAPPEKPGDRPTGPPDFKTMAGYIPCWYPGIGWTEIPNTL